MCLDKQVLLNWIDDHSLSKKQNKTKSNLYMMNSVKLFKKIIFAWVFWKK